MSTALAEGILALDFPEEDVARIEELNVKANDGTLTDEEESELEAYANIGELLAYWQSKARQKLQHPAWVGRPRRYGSALAIVVSTVTYRKRRSAGVSTSNTLSPGNMVDRQAWTTLHSPVGRATWKKGPTALSLRSFIREHRWPEHFSAHVATLIALGIEIRGLTPADARWFEYSL
jgi:hypothetical protein